MSLGSPAQRRRKGVTMRFQIGPLPAMLAVALTAACGSTRTIDVYATVLDKNQDGTPDLISIQKDRVHHDSVVVNPRDRIKFRCFDCPEGAQFGVGKIQYLGDLDDIVDVMLDHKLLDAESLGKHIEGLKTLRPEAMRSEEALAEEGKTEVDQLENTVAVLSKLLSVLPPSERAPGLVEKPRSPSLFKRDWAGSCRTKSDEPCYVSAREEIISKRVERMEKPERTRLWKFTWWVRLPGVGEDTWDPHIVDHPDDHEWY